MEWFYIHIPQYTVHERNISGHISNSDLSLFLYPPKQKLVHQLYYQWDPHIIWIGAKVWSDDQKQMHIFHTLIFIRSDWTFTYIHSIVESSYNTGLYPGFSFYSRFWSPPHNISHTWDIFYPRIFVSFTIQGEHCLFVLNPYLSLSHIACN